MPTSAPEYDDRMRRALVLACRGLGKTSPNPMVGALLVKRGQVIGEGWHRGASQPHAEIEALADAARRGHSPKDATLFVTLEPCCTYGRTPPCTDAILRAGIRRVVVGATDPNPAHAGRGYEILRAAGLEVLAGVLEPEATGLNRAFNHWIVTRTPLVTLKAALTLDGKIATANGESKWITGESARRHVLKMRQAHDAVLVGLNTVLADDPGLLPLRPEFPRGPELRPRRIILDSQARTPPGARVVTDDQADRTLIAVGDQAPKRRVEKLRARVRVLVAPTRDGRIDLPWLMRELGRQSLTSLLVEGGGEVHASFLTAGAAQRAAFFYAPKILGGATSRRAVAGDGFTDLKSAVRLDSIRTRRFGEDLLLEGDLRYAAAGKVLKS